MNEKVLVIGSVTADIHIYTDHLPSYEEDINVRRHEIAVGGCAYNAAAVLHRLGVPYTLFSPVGTGIYGEYIAEQCRKTGIIPSLKSSEEHGCCYCLIDETGGRTFLAVHGTEYLFRPEMFDSVDLREYGMIYVCGLEIEEKTGDTILAFLEQTEGKKIVYAPGPRIKHIGRTENLRMFRLADLIHLNRREINQFLDEEKISCLTDRDTVNALRQYTDADFVITDGDKEVTVISGSEISRIPVNAVRQVNSTGAGDAHIGAVMGMLMKGSDLQEAVRTANRISAEIVMSD